jgi:hypothetical protein
VRMLTADKFEQRDRMTSAIVRMSIQAPLLVSHSYPLLRPVFRSMLHDLPGILVVARCCTIAKSLCFPAECLSPTRDCGLTDPCRRTG